MHDYPTPVKISPPSGASRGSWDARKGLLQQQFPVLTDRDLILTPNNREAMFENLLTKLGKTEQELHAIIISL